MVSGLHYLGLEVRQEIMGAGAHGRGHSPCGSQEAERGREREREKRRKKDGEQGKIPFKHHPQWPHLPHIHPTVYLRLESTDEGRALVIPQNPTSELCFYQGHEPFGRPFTSKTRDERTLGSMGIKVPLSKQM
jgi:hypothetical protein